MAKRKGRAVWNYLHERGIDPDNISFASAERWHRRTMENRRIERLQEVHSWVTGQRVVTKRPSVDSASSRINSKATGRVRAYFELVRRSLRAGFTPGPDSDVGEPKRSRETVTRRGERRGRTQNAPSTSGSRGFFSQPKKTTPTAPATERIGIGGVESRRQRSAGVFAGYGTSGVAGTRSSYGVRSMSKLVTSPTQRMRLSLPGYMAILSSQAANIESQALNQETIDSHNPGGFRSMSEEEQNAATRGIGFRGRPGRMLRRGAGLVLGLVEGVRHLWWELGATEGPFGIDSPGEAETEAARRSLVKNLNRMNLISAWVEGGVEGRNKMQFMLDFAGSPEAYQSHNSMMETMVEAKKRREKFFKDVANDIAKTAVGVDGDVAVEGLRTMNKSKIEEYMSSQLTEADRVVAADVQRRFKEVQKTLGTKK